MLSVDIGFRVALFNRADRQHVRARALAQALHARRVTTWSVLTEVSHLLPSVGTQGWRGALLCGHGKAFELDAEARARGSCR